MSINSQLPETGFLRLPQVLHLIPVSKSTWWAGVQTSRFPKGIKLGPRTTAWRVEDIRCLLESFTAEEKATTNVGGAR
jgi:prophage regulatory protein